MVFRQMRWAGLVTRRPFERAEASEPETIDEPFAAYLAHYQVTVNCPDLADAVGYPPAMNLVITVESYSDNAFDPVAGVIVAALGRASREHGEDEQLLRQRLGRRD